MLNIVTIIQYINYFVKFLYNPHQTQKRVINCNIKSPLCDWLKYISDHLGEEYKYVDIISQLI